jgi:hypothetical protein
MSVTQVGLVDKTGKLDAQLVEATAAALNIQVRRDLEPVWNVRPLSGTYLTRRVFRQKCGRYS